MLVVEVTGTLDRFVKSFTVYMGASRNTVYSEGDHLSAPSSTFLPLLPGHK